MSCLSNNSKYVLLVTFFFWPAHAGAVVEQYVDEPVVEIDGRDFRVEFDDNHFSQSTVIEVVNCDRLVIRNVRIVNATNVPNGGRDGIRVFFCRDVLIEDVYIEGPWSGHAIRIRNCGHAEIRRVEIAGRLHGSEFWAGGGIKLCNDRHAGIHGGCSDPDSADTRGYDSLGFLAEDFYIHSRSLYETANNNQDAILVSSIWDSMIRRGIIADWHGDRGIDFSFRDGTASEDRWLLVDRVVLDNAPIGSAGDSGAGTIFVTNSLFEHSKVIAYQGGGTNVFYLHNTFRGVHPTRAGEYLLVDWGVRGGSGVQLYNNAIQTDIPIKHYYYGNESATVNGAYDNWAADHNVLDVDVLSNWAEVEDPAFQDLLTWEDWVDRGLDQNSLMTDPMFFDETGGDLRPREGSPLVDRGDPSARDLVRDFTGHDVLAFDLALTPRDERPDVGAYEFGAADPCRDPRVGHGCDPPDADGGGDDAGVADAAAESGPGEEEGTDGDEEPTTDPGQDGGAASDRQFASPQGCGCRRPGSHAPSRGALLTLLMLCLITTRRRRRGTGP